MLIHDAGYFSISHCRSIKAAFAACRRWTEERPSHRAEYRRALKRRIRVLKHREEKASQDQLALLEAQRQNHLDSIAADLGLRIERVA